MLTPFQLPLTGLELRLPASMLAAPQARHLVLHACLHIDTVDAETQAFCQDSGCTLLQVPLLREQELRFNEAGSNVCRLSERLLATLAYLRYAPQLRDLPLLLCAEGAVSPAAIRACSERDAQVVALGCWGGEIDRAGRQYLRWLQRPLAMLFAADDQAGPASLARAQAYLSQPPCVLASDCEQAPTAPLARLVRWALAQPAG